MAETVTCDPLFVRRWALLAEGLAILSVCLAPLALGATEPWSIQLCAAIAVVAAAVLLFARPDSFGLSPLLLSLLGWTAVLVLQLIPLPPGIWPWISPSHQKLFDQVLGPIGLYPAWRPISLDRAATALEAVRTFGWAALGLTLARFARERADSRRRLLWSLAMTGGVVALIGSIHWLAGSERLFGRFGYSWAVPFPTTFANPNHAAGFLNMAFLVALGLACASETARGRIAALCLSLGTFFGSLLCDSRGGIAGLIAGLLLLAFLVAPSLAGKTRKTVLAGLAVLAAALIALLLCKPGMTPAKWFAADGKIRALSSTVRLIADHPVAGIGAGAYETAHTRYLPEAKPLVYTHVENEPLEMVAELGIPLGSLVLLLTLAAGVVLLRRAREKPREEAGAAAAAVAIVLQNMVDFSLEYACGFALVALLACDPGSQRPSWSLPRWLTGLACALMLGAAFLAYPTLLADTTMLQKSLEDGIAGTVLEDRCRSSLERRPSDFFPCQVAGLGRLLTNDPDGALQWFGRGLLLHPRSRILFAGAAEAHARRGERQQALEYWRQAAAMDLPVMSALLRHYRDREAILFVAPTHREGAKAALRSLIEASLYDAAQAVFARVPDPDQELIELLQLAKQKPGGIPP